MKIKIGELIKLEGKKLVWQPLKPAILEAWAKSKKYPYGRIKFGTAMIQEDTGILDKYAPFILWIKKSTFRKYIKLQKIKKSKKQKNSGG